MDKKYSVKRELGSVKWKLHISDSLLREKMWEIKGLEGKIRELEKRIHQLTIENESIYGKGLERFVEK